MKPFLLFCAGVQLSGAALAQTALPPAPLPPLPTPVDYAGAIWTPAAPGNFDPVERPENEKIDMVVVHDIEGTASAAINIFQRPGASVSAHYIVGSDGQIFQMVRERNVAWHAGNRGINHRSVGIETEGYAYRPGWYNPATYEAEARLVRDITRRYNIPRDRSHIIGHAEVPHPSDPTKFGGISGHTDPGPYWNWTTFMTLVRNDAHLVEASVPATIRPGEVVTASVTLENRGDDLWPANTARDPKVALQANGPIVVLGTVSGGPSPLYSPSTWVSPTIAAGAATDTAPAASARFEFTLRGPRDLGAWSDQLRLSTMPTAAQGTSPVSFGDQISIATRVVPWVIDVPSPDAPVPASAVSSTTARWSAALPIGGVYAVYVGPPKPPKTRRQKPFSYQFSTLDGAKKVVVRPKDGGRGLIFAGYFRFPEPLKEAPTSSIELQSAPQGVAASNAGAVRFIGPFPTASLASASPTPPDLGQIPGAR